MRWSRVFTLAAIAAWLMAGAAALHFFLTLPHWQASVGVDYKVVMSVGRYWSETGQMYWPHQLAGPYTMAGAETSPYGGDSLYPPVALLLFVPAGYLPAALWWAIPLALTAAAIVMMRPAPWGWLVMGLLLMLPVVRAPLFWGNPVMWVLPAIAWGFLRGWPAVIVLVKPTLALFALSGLARPKPFLLALAVFIALAIPFGDLWSDWVKAIWYAHLGPLYSLRQVPLLLIPVVAWVSRRSSPRTA